MVARWPVSGAGILGGSGRTVVLGGERTWQVMVNDE